MASPRIKNICRMKIIISLIIIMVCATSVYAQSSWYAHYDLALEAISLNRWQEAIDHLQAAIDLKPEPELNAHTYGVWRKHYLPYFHLGVAYYNLGEYELAEEYLRRSLENGTIRDNPESLSALESAIAAINERESISSQEMSTRINDEYSQARALVDKGLLDEARVKLESVLTLDPENKPAAATLDSIKKVIRAQEKDELTAARISSMIERATIQLQQKRPSRALIILDSLRLFSKDTPASDSLRSLALTKQVELKQKESEQRTRSNEYLALGKVALDRKNYKEAWNNFRRALEIFPGNEEANECLQTAMDLENEMKRQQQLVQFEDSAVRLIAIDSLLAARDQLTQAAAIDHEGRVDSLLRWVNSVIHERNRSSRERDLPQLILSYPPDNMNLTLTRPEVRISGSAFDNSGIESIIVRIGDREKNLFPSREQLGTPSRVSFDENLALIKGDNIIVLTVTDNHGLQASLERKVVYVPPFWRNPYFIAIWMVALIALSTFYYVARRNRIQAALNKIRKRPFRIISPNPFIVGNPIRTREMFFGREDDFTYVRSKLDSENLGALIVLFGERRAGKTSVLYQILGGRLGTRFVPVFIDMQAMAVTGDHDFLGRMAEIILSSLPEDCSLDFDMQVFNNREQNPFTNFERFIDNVLLSAGHRKLLLLFDEYELIEDKVEDNKISKDIFFFLSGLVEHKIGLFLIFAGNHRLQERKKNYWQPLLHRCEYRNISFLTESDTRRLILEPVRDRIFYLGSAVSQITRLTAGQPFYTQLFCRNVVEYLNREKRNYFSHSDIQMVVNEIVDNPPPQLIYFWAGLDKEEKITLSLCANLPKNPDHSISIREIAQQIEKYKLKIPLDVIKKTCDRLVDREIFERNSGDDYHYRMELLRLWIKEEHNLYSLFREIEHDITID